MSWPLLLTIAVVVAGSLHLLSYNVVYTEGEVMQGLFGLLVGVVACCVLVGFYRRKIAVWLVTVIGGSLLVWQAYQLRKWAMIHEEVLSLVRFAEESKVRTGSYPTNLAGYVFKREWLKSYVRTTAPDRSHGFRIDYFINHPGVSYWYTSQTGFGYHPD